MEWIFRIFASDAMLLLFTLSGLGILVVVFGWWFRKTADRSLSAKDAEWNIVLKGAGKKKTRSNNERGVK